VLALGVVTSFFNIPGMEQYSYGIKSIEDITQLRKHLHDELLRTGHLDRDYVVVGAGPTGVELAAALVSYIRNIAKMHHIQAKKVRLQLIEAAPRILPHSRKSAAKLVEQRLKKLGVSITTGKMVQAASPNMLTVDGKELPTETVIWTAGVSNNPFFQANAAHFQFSKSHKVQVDNHLQAAPDIYVIGDNAATPYSGLAQTAVYDGGYLAKNLQRLVRGKKPKTYRARRPITVIPVGAHWAVVEYGVLVMTGVLGALLRKIADFIGYHDVMPLFMALTLITATEPAEEDCTICRDAAN
jgi:NADH dehydrogenase